MSFSEPKVPDGFDLHNGVCFTVLKCYKVCIYSVVLIASIFMSRSTLILYNLEICFVALIFFLILTQAICCVHIRTASMRTNYQLKGKK